MNLGTFHSKCFACLALGLLFSMASSGAVPLRTQAAQQGWPMFGGAPSRNLVNVLDKNLPGQWSVTAGERTNIKWFAEPGSRTAMLGQPVIAEGRVFISAADREA